MGLHNPPKSILDQPNPEHQGSVFGGGFGTRRPQGYTDAVIDQQTTNETEHHVEQHAALFRGTDDHPVHDGGDYPRHVHSTENFGEHFVVVDQEHHDKVLATGKWSDTPMGAAKNGASLPVTEVVIKSDTPMDVIQIGSEPKEEE